MHNCESKNKERNKKETKTKQKKKKKETKTKNKNKNNKMTLIFQNFGSVGEQIYFFRPNNKINRLAKHR